MPSDKKLIRSEDFISEMIERARAIDENLVVKHMEVISKSMSYWPTNWLTDQLTGIGARDKSGENLVVKHMEVVSTARPLEAVMAKPGSHCTVNDHC